MIYLHSFFACCFFTGFQIESFDNPADFFMDITNGEAKSTLGTLTTGITSNTLLRYCMVYTNRG